MHIWRKKIIRSQWSVWYIYSTLSFLFTVTIQHMSCDLLQMCLKSMVLEFQVKENNRFSFSYYVALEEIWTAKPKKSLPVLMILGKLISLSLSFLNSKTWNIKTSKYFQKKMIKFLTQHVNALKVQIPLPPNPSFWVSSSYS